MPQSDELLAWIEPRTSNECLAAFVAAAAAAERAPATQLCATPDQARQWVEEEAAALGVSVAWVSRSPTG
jgi:hypothetical protein